MVTVTIECETYENEDDGMMVYWVGSLDSCEHVSVPQKVLDKWTRVMREYEEVQDEMSSFFYKQAAMRYGKGE
jgi:hypothetical protein